MNDDGKSQNDDVQHAAHMNDLIEQLDLLEAVDRRITPERIARRFREMRLVISDEMHLLRSGERPSWVVDQPDQASQIRGLWRKHDAEYCTELTDVSGSLEAAVAAARDAAADIIADVQRKATVAAGELQRAQEAVVMARQEAEQIMSDARAEADEALDVAVRMVRDARDEAEQILSQARIEAEQIVTIADEQQAQRSDRQRCLVILDLPGVGAAEDVSFRTSCAADSVRLWSHSRQQAEPHRAWSRTLLGSALIAVSAEPELGVARFTSAHELYRALSQADLEGERPISADVAVRTVVRDLSAGLSNLVALRGLSLAAAEDGGGAAALLLAGYGERSSQSSRWGDLAALHALSLAAAEDGGGAAALLLAGHGERSSQSSRWGDLAALHALSLAAAEDGAGAAALLLAGHGERSSRPSELSGPRGTAQLVPGGCREPSRRRCTATQGPSRGLETSTGCAS